MSGETSTRRYEAMTPATATLGHLAVPARPQTPRPRPSADAPVSVVSGHSEPFEYSCGCSDEAGTAHEAAPREWVGVDDDSVPPVPDVPQQHRRPISTPPPPPLPPKDRYIYRRHDAGLDAGPSTISQTLVHGTLPLAPPAHMPPAPAVNRQYSGKYLYPRTAPPVPPTRPWSALHAGGDVLEQGVSSAAWSASGPSRRAVPVRSETHSPVRQEIHGPVRQGRRRHRPPLPWPLAPRAPTLAQQYSAEIRHTRPLTTAAPAPVPVPVTPRPPEPSAVYPFPAVAASAVSPRRQRSWSWRQRGGEIVAGVEVRVESQGGENATYPPSISLEPARPAATLLRAVATSLATTSLSVGFGLLRTHDGGGPIYAPALGTYTAALALAALLSVHSGITACDVLRRADGGATVVSLPAPTLLIHAASILVQVLPHALALLSPPVALAASGVTLALIPSHGARHVHAAAALAVVASALLVPGAVAAVVYFAHLIRAVPAPND